MIPRSPEKELLDVQTPPREDLRAALLNLATTNRLFLNNLLIAHYVKRLANNQANATLLDIGTGLGDIPLYLSTKLGLRATGIDLNPVVTDLANEYVGVNKLVSIENKRLEDYAENQFTVATMSQVLHHQTPSEAGELIRTALSKVTRGLVISDLIRNRFNYYLVKFGTTISGGNRFNKTDGPLSVLRSYSDPEIKQILNAAGIKKFTIHNFIFRKIIVMPKQ